MGNYSKNLVAKLLLSLSVKSAVAKVMPTTTDRPNFGYGYGFGAETVENEFFPGFGFGHESFGQATATAETGDWFRPATECV